jgi:hypothetical protein
MVIVERLRIGLASVTQQLARRLPWRCRLASETQLRCGVERVTGLLP